MSLPADDLSAIDMRDITNHEFLIFEIENRLRISAMSPLLCIGWKAAMTW
ncbi:hypothetical protein [Brytella acorum]|uniref:Uncharacterized protein n=1 Tax=Brytella acorum TaxID=2959299 RepID=A0AA35UJI0_9PROT|nr:hypothetical protein [Brytella acorum]CAI9121485.1 hypothetical protein LMG32879_002332 [Brytella acorum]